MESEINRGETLFLQGKVEKAKAWFMNMLAQNPEEPRILNNLGVISFSRDRFEEAEQYFLRALELETDNADALLNLGQVYIRTSQWKPAADILERALLSNHENEDIYKQLAMAYQGMGEAESAQKAVQRSHQGALSYEEPRPQGGASSKEKAKLIWGRSPQTFSGHSSPCKARGILAFSRKILNHDEESSESDTSPQDHDPDTFVSHGNGLSWYEKNLDCLTKKDPHLASRLRDLALSDEIFLDPAGDALPNLMIKDHKGRNRRVYPGEDPALTVQEELNDHRFRAEDATLFLGFGLGYHIEGIVRRMEQGHRVFVVEPFPGIFQSAMAARDLGKLLSDERIHFFLGEDLDGLYEALEYHMMRFVAGELNELILPRLWKIYPEVYAETRDRIQKILSHLTLSFRHCMNAHGLLKNILSNAGGLTEAVDVKTLFGLLDNRPAVVVSGGPSLTKNIRLLADVKDKACIIAVDTALKPLCHNGITPDFVVSADPYEQNLKKVKGIPSAAKIPLVFIPDVYHEIPKRFSRVRFVSRSPNALNKWLLDLIGYQGDLGSPTSASHLAFYLARAMGADPIILVGLDLAFPGEDHHVRGAEPTWAPKTDQEYVFVPDVFGGQVKTIPGFHAMIGLFEREIARTGVQCIDATEGGALIRGTEIMDLRTAIRQFVLKAGDETGKIIEDRLANLPRVPRESKARLLEGLVWLLSEANTLSDLSRDILPVIERAMDMIGKGGQQTRAFSRLGAKIQAADQCLAEKAQFDRVMIDFRAELLVYQYLQAYKIKKEKDPPKNLLLSLESIQRSFDDAKRLADTVVSILQSIASDEQKGNTCAT
jgi:hypothetical protein